MNKIIIGTVFSALTLFTACDMDQFPSTSISTETAWSTIDDAARFENGIYSLLRTCNGGLYISTTDLQSDLFNATYGFGNNGGDLHRWDFTNFQYDIEDIYQNNYYCINNCNNIINNIDKITIASEEEQVQANNIKGTAYLMRAMCYHTLVVRFAKDYEPSTAATDLGLALVEENDPNAKPSRSTLQETYDQIKSDIAQARQLMTREGEADSYYLTKDVIDALEARVDLYMHNYSEALSLSQGLMAKYPLASSAEELTSMFLNDSGSEIIYRVFSSVDERENEMSYYMNWSTATNSWGAFFLPSQWVIDMYEDKDLRKNIYFSKDTVTCSDRKGVVYMLNKYPGNPALKKTDYEYYNMPKLFRSAECWLIAAEAAYRSGDEATALKYVNELATSRGASAITSTSGKGLFMAIQNEWIREFAGEGNRLNDLKRWHEGFQRHDPQDANLLTLGTGMESLSIEADNQRFVWEIPANDLNANQNLVGNWN